MRTARSFTLAVVSSLCVSAIAAAQARSTAHDHAATQTSGGSAVATAPLTALLTGPLGTHSATGTATVEGRTVRVTWAGDRPGSTRPWYVRRGTCSRDDGVLGAAGAYRPITVDAGGNGTATATLDAPLADGHAYVVAVLDSLTEAGSDVIACGPLTDGASNAARPSGHQSEQMSMLSMQHRSTPLPGRAAGAAATDHSGMDHSGMDHSAMAMRGTAMPSAAGAASADSASATLMSIYVRMMADPVIRERVMTDPVLQRMMSALPGAGVTGGAAAGTGAASPSGAESHEGMDMPGLSPGATQPAERPASTAKPAASKPAASKPAAKPAPKRAPAPAKDPMKGMDHSKMPGMRKP